MSELMEGKEAFKESQQLVKVSKVDIPIIFAAKGLDPLIGKIKEEANNYVSDVTTAIGRERLKSFAYKIKRSRTYLEEVGKTYVTSLKKIPKVVDAERKRMRRELDALYDSTRRPLTDWEDEQKKIKEEEDKKKELIAAYEEAIIEDNFLNRQREVERKEVVIKLREEEQAAKELKIKEEQVRKEREEKIRVDAAENAKQEAEKKIAEERAAKERVEWQAKEDAEKAEREKKEAIENAKKEKEEAIVVERVKAELEAKKKEADQLEKEAKEKREAEIKAADSKHMANIKNEAYGCFVKNAVSKDEAKRIIELIDSGLIKNVSINFF